MTQASKKVYIVAAKRTPITNFNEHFKSISVGELAAHAIRGALESIQLPSNEVEEVILGHVLGASQGMGPGRQAALFAGIPETVPAYSVNMVCGSGMKAVMDAYAHIQAGDAEVIVAAGAENMSQAPFALPGKHRAGQKMGDYQLQDLLIKDGLTDVFNQYHMGVTAENIANELAISREQQDQYALHSQQKAVAAIEAGRFVDEIVPVTVTERRKSQVIEQDQYPKQDATYDALAALRPAFDKQGSVTAGNASGLNDGASAVILVSEDALTRLGLTPLAEIVSYAQAGLDPKVMGLGPVPAISKALAKAELSLAEIDLLELNEAFAVQALGVTQQLAEQHQVNLEQLMQRVNVNGGAIALGHPLGASGNRILVSLIHEMKKRQETYGVASLCVGGGMGTAMVIKNITMN